MGKGALVSSVSVLYRCLHSHLFELPAVQAQYPSVRFGFKLVSSGISSRSSSLSVDGQLFSAETTDNSVLGASCRKQYLLLLSPTSRLSSSHKPPSLKTWPKIWFSCPTVFTGNAPNCSLGHTPHTVLTMFVQSLSR